MCESGDLLLSLTQLAVHYAHAGIIQIAMITELSVDFILDEMDDEEKEAEATEVGDGDEEETE